MNPAQPNVRFVYTTRERYNTIINKQDGTLYYLYDEKVVMLNGEQYGITSSELINKIDSEITSKVIDFKGVADGFATLDGDGKVPASQLPSITITLDDVEGLATALSNIGIDITTLEGRVDQTETDINTLEGRVDQTETDISALDSKIDSEIENLDSKIDSEIENLDLNTIDGTLMVSKGGTGQTNFTLDEVLVGNNENPIKTAPTINLGDTQVIKDIEEEIDLLHGGIGSLQTDLDDLTFEDIDGEINLDTQVPPIPFSKLTISQANLTETINLDDTEVINDIGNRIGELDGDIALVEEEIDKLQDDIGNIQEDFDNLTFEDIDGVAEVGQIPPIPFDKLDISPANLTGTINLGDTQVIKDIENNLEGLHRDVSGLQEDLEDHTHNASDIISGTLPVARGGTGRDTLTKDYVLVGDGANQIKTVPTALIQEWAMGDIPTAEEVGARPEDWTPTWTEVEDKPDKFDPTPHEHLFTDITDVAKVDQIPDLPLSKIEDIDLVDVIDIADITIVKDKVDGLPEALSGIESDITNLEGRVDQAETGIDNLDNKIDSEIDSLNLNTIKGTLSVSKGGTGRISFALDEVLVGNNENPVKTAPTALIQEWAMKLNLDPDDVPDLPISKIENLEIRLQDIEDIAETNVQSDWTETDTTADSYIQNKPEEINLTDIPYIQDLASNVSENATNINTHTNQINTLNVELGTLEGSLNNLGTRVESNEDNISTINSEIDGINNTLQNKSDKGHKHKSSDITDAVNIAEIPLTTLDGNLPISRITSLKTELDKTIEDIKVNGTSLTKTNKSVSITIPSPPTLENIGGTLPVSKGGTGRTTLTQDRVLVGDGTNQVKLVEQINLHNSQIKLPQSQITDLVEDLEDLESDITTNTGNITDLTTRVEANEDDIDSLQSGLGTAQSNISSLTNRVGTAESNITTLDGKVTTNTTNITNLTTRVETNEDNIGDIQTELSNQINIEQVPIVKGMYDDNYFKGVTLDETYFKITFTRRDGTTAVIDLPLESVVVNGSYDTENKKIILTLQNESTIEISVADLVTGLVSIPDLAKGETSNKTLGTTGTFKVLHISTSGTITEKTMTLNITANDVLGVPLEADKVLVGAGSNQVKLVDQIPISAWAMKSNLDPEDVPSIPISRVTNLQTQLNSKQDSIGYTPENIANKKTSWSDTVNHTNYPSEKLVKDSLDSKVDKEVNKGLSTNDFTTELKNRLTGIEANAQVNKIESISLDSVELPISSNKRVSIPTTPISAWALKQELDPEDVPDLLINQITGLQGELDSLQTDIGKAVLTTTDQNVAGEKTFKNITTFEKGVIIPSQNSYIDLGKKTNWFWTRFSGENWTFNNTYTGGGWARNLLEMKDAEGTAYFRIGAQGSSQNFTQMYIGPAYNNYWLSLNDDRALFRAKPQYASNPTTNNDLTRKYYVDTQLATKQDKLVSGTNIKSFNGQTLLGQGAFEIETNKVLGRTSSDSGEVEQIDLINIDGLGFAKADDIPTIPDIEVSKTGTGGVITGIAVDGTNNHKLNITQRGRSGIDTRTIFPTNWTNVGSKPTTLSGYGITLSGDVSNTNNAITISNSAITTAKIANNAITNAKILNSTIALTKLANIDSQTVLGNATSSTGAVTTIPLINIDDLDLVETSELSSYATKTELTSGLAGKSDTGHKHTTADITALTGLPTTATGSISTADTLNVALRKLQTQIDSKTSNTGTVTSVTLSGGTGISITNPTITTTGTITVALSNMNANTIKGRISSNGAPQNLTAAQVRTILNVADGAQKNVQSDWSATSGDAFIKNKPTTFTPSSHGHTWSEITGKPTTFTPSSHTHNYTDITGLEANKVLGRNTGDGPAELISTIQIPSWAMEGTKPTYNYDDIQGTKPPTNAQKNVQSDWNATSGDAFIRNKPDVVVLADVAVNPTISKIVKRGTDGSASATSFKTGSAEIKYNNTTKSIDFIFS
jgi:predicted  nucleic acid-binding Zn-ribbon protein